VVSLSSSNSTAAKVPVSVTVPQGSTSATFSVTTGSVTTATSVTLTASYAGVSETFGLTVNPPPPTLSSVSVSPNTIVSGQAGTGTVSLTSAAGSGGVVVSLSSSNSTAASVPATITVPQGSSTATFLVSAGMVNTPTTVVLTASYAGVSMTTNLTVVPVAQPPTAPGSLTATDPSVGQINLSWTASTDSLGVTAYLVERCQGAVCTNFAQIGTSTSTTYTDSGLRAKTTYLYRVRATDAAGNLSAYSNVASATTLAPGIRYVQGNYATPQSPQSTVSVTFATAQNAGNLNVIVVGWNDTTAVVSAVTDTGGNTYMLAVGPTVVKGSLSQSIYYAKNILAGDGGANTVTVTFSVAAASPDIRILEYSGVDRNNPVDVSVAKSGNSKATKSGLVTTTNADDLLFAANTVGTFTTNAGAGFRNRMITSPDGDIVEDRTVTAIGTYNATAPLSLSGPWIMQLVAFRAAQ
jgi:chitodextrinase